MSERRQMVQSLPVTRRCELLEVARSTAYYRPSPVSEADMRLIEDSSRTPVLRQSSDARRTGDPRALGQSQA